jgi:hypothetical protein
MDLTCDYDGGDKEFLQNIDGKSLDKLPHGKPR